MISCIFVPPLPFQWIRLLFLTVTAGIHRNRSISWIEVKLRPYLERQACLMYEPLGSENSASTFHILFYVFRWKMSFNFYPCFLHRFFGPKFSVAFKKNKSFRALSTIWERNHYFYEPKTVFLPRSGWENIPTAIMWCKSFFLHKWQERSRSIIQMNIFCRPGRETFTFRECFSIMWRWSESFALYDAVMGVGGSAPFTMMKSNSRYTINSSFNVEPKIATKEA